jgi:hypothetical protein
MMPLSQRDEEQKADKLQSRMCKVSQQRGAIPNPPEECVKEFPGNAR